MYAFDFFFFKLFFVLKHKENKENVENIFDFYFYLI